MAHELSIDAPKLRAQPNRWALRFLTTFADRLTVGRLVIQTPNGGVIDRNTGQPGPDATLVLHRWRAIRRLLFGGDLGFAEAYIDGDWSSPDLPSLIELGALNESSVPTDFRGARLARLIHRFRHKTRANTKQGSRKNIQDHYDVGNDFYSLWLDPGMSYSSGLYHTADDRLEAAQDAKQQRIIELLDVNPDCKTLEIGCGWGGLAERIIREQGGHVTGLTLSPSQLEIAQKRIDDAGLSDRADLKLMDYRDVAGKFDRIVSIEMLEAVGEEYWATYFQRVRERLTQGGKAVLQVITIKDSIFDEYRVGADFIQRYVFPGGMLPSPTILRDHIAKAGLKLTHYETFGRSYARTLSAWHQQFQRAWPDIAKLGYSARFKRIWEYYFSYCEAGFLTGRIDVCLCRLETNTAS